jgi:Zn-dependent peptidase ImmA (M78 family)
MKNLSLLSLALAKAETESVRKAAEHFALQLQGESNPFEKGYLGKCAKLAGVKAVRLIDDLQTDGVVVPYGESYVIELRKGLSPARGRFTIAHEIGHIVLYNLIPIGSRQDTSMFQRGQSAIERFCDCFAACLLLPRKEVIEYFSWAEVSGKTIYNLSEEVKVSLISVLGRCREYSVLDDLKSIVLLYRTTGSDECMPFMPTYLFIDKFGSWISSANLFIESNDNLEFSDMVNQGKKLIVASIVERFRKLTICKIVKNEPIN